MKVLIVFSAFLMIFSMFMVYTADMNKYISIQKDLKSLAEDCAEAGALTIDENTQMIDKKEADKSAEAILSGSVFGGSVVIERSGLTKDARGYELTLLLTSKDIFRLPFLTITEIRRTSEYAWE